MYITLIGVQNYKNIVKTGAQKVKILPLLQEKTVLIFH
jgi:hypothetical protein